jgi:hypothetical protein
MPILLKSIKVEKSRKRQALSYWVRVAGLVGWGTTAETWHARIQKLSGGRLLGRFFAASRQRLREVSERLGLRRAVNLGGCLAT